jgi:DDE domain
MYLEGWWAASNYQKWRLLAANAPNLRDPQYRVQPPLKNRSPPRVGVLRPERKRQAIAAAETAPRWRAYGIAVQPFRHAAGEGAGLGLSTRQTAVEFVDTCSPIGAAQQRHDTGLVPRQEVEHGRRRRRGCFQHQIIAVNAHADAGSQHAIWLYLRFTLSFRDVEDLLAERGITVSYETVRRWVNHFGPMVAADLRKRRSKPHTTWHLDEVYLKIDGRMVYLWRAVDAQGEVLDVLIQSGRNKRAALKLIRKLLKKYGFVPDKLVTDDLKSYSAAAHNRKTPRARPMAQQPSRE